MQMMMITENIILCGNPNKKSNEDNFVNLENHLKGVLNSALEWLKTCQVTVLFELVLLLLKLKNTVLINQ